MQGVQLGPNCCTGTPSNVTLDRINIGNGCLSVMYDHPQPSNITFKNAHVWATANASCHLINLKSTSGFTLSNVDVGPMCCDGDGIELGIATPGDPNPTNIVMDRVYIHDIYDTCNNMPSGLKSQYGCSGLGFGDNGIGDHVDGIQAFGCSNCTLSNSRIYAINPRSASSTGAAQGVFYAVANGGTFSNLTFLNNMVACGCGMNVFGVGSAPQVGGVSGYVKFLYNSVQGSMTIDDRAGQSSLAPGTQIVYAGNITGGIHSAPAGEAANACYFTATDGSRVTPTFAANLFPNFTCSPTDRTGLPSWLSTNFYAPDFHLSSTAQPARGTGASPYCPTTNIDGATRTVCNIGAD
jgi:hypothetical protein